MWVQKLNKLGLISMNKLGTLGKRGRVADTEHVPRAVFDKLTGTMRYTFPWEDTPKFQEYTGHQSELLGSENWQQLRDCRCSTMERTNRWRMDVHSSVDKTSHLTTAVLRRVC